MAVIEKKIWPGLYDAMASGKMNSELRLGDFDIEEGDTLLLKEWDPKIKEYTGREIRKEVCYVAKVKIDKLFWTEEDIKKHGLQIISLK